MDPDRSESSRPTGSFRWIFRNFRRKVQGVSIETKNYKVLPRLCSFATRDGMDPKGGGGCWVCHKGLTLCNGYSVGIWDMG